MNKTLLNLIIITAVSTTAFGQLNIPEYSIETGAIGQFGKRKPFWFYSNQDGKFSPDNSCVFTDLYIKSHADTSKTLNILYGAEGFLSYNRDFNPKLVQAYTEIKYGFVKFMAGKKAEAFGEMQSDITSGPLLYSRNAPPIPKVAIGSDGYFDVPFTYGYMELKGYLAHGWLGMDRYVKGAYLHQKHAYARLGGDLPVNFYYGMQHYAIWGGKSPRYGQLPNDFDAFLRVSTARNADSIQTDIPNETLNALGDHRGSHNYGFNIKTNKANYYIYYQSVFEDLSGIRFLNFPDGLWGVAYESRRKTKNFIELATFEFTHTKYQGGKKNPDIFFDNADDNYFYNGIYLTGWINNDFTIGTPFINDPDTNRIINNRVSSHYFGINGFISNNLSYMLKGAYSLNYGKHTLPYDHPRDHFSVYLNIVYSLKKWNSTYLSFSSSLDFGRMYKTNSALMLSLIFRNPALFKQVQ